MRFAYTHADTHLVDYAPMIEHDAGGQLVGIRFSPKLDFVPLAEAAVLAAFYAARRTLNQMLVSDEFEIRFLLADGDLVMFDNRRLLHGRTSVSYTHLDVYKRQARDSPASGNRRRHRCRI